MKSICLVVSLGVLLAVSFVSLEVYADEAEDFAIRHAQQRFYEAPENAREISMGGSIVTTSANATSVFGNPAGLGWLTRPEISATYLRLDMRGKAYSSECGECYPDLGGIHEIRHMGHIEAAYPFEEGETGVLGAGWAGYWSDLDDSLSSDTSGYHIAVAYGRQIADQWSVGYALTYREDKDKNIIMSYELDHGITNKIGVQFRPFDNLTFGTSGYYSFADVKVQTPFYYGETTALGLAPSGNTLRDDRDSFGADVGVAWQMLDRTLVAASIDASHSDYDLGETGSRLGARVGVEQMLTEWLYLRGGYRYSDSNYDFNDSGSPASVSGDSDLQAASAGVGVKYDNISLDYAFERALGDSSHLLHAITLSYIF